AAALFHHEAQAGSSRLRHALHHGGRYPNGLDDYQLHTSRADEWVPVSLTVTRLHLHRPLSLFPARDVRYQRAMLAKVRQLEAEWRQVLASVSDCLWSAEVAPDGRWTYRYLSPVVQAITGHPPDYFLADHARWFALIHPADRPAVEAARQRLLAGATEAVTEHRLVRPDGAVRWVRSSIRASPGRTGRRLDGVLADVTASREATEALRRSEERFRTLVEKSTDVVSLLDAAGVVRYVTPSEVRATGYRPEGAV